MTAACVVLVVLCLVVSAGCINPLLNRENVIVPRITPVQNAPSPAAPVYTYPFERSTITFTMPVNGSVYAGAKAADKEVTVYGNVSKQEWSSRTYLSMVSDPNQEEFYQELLARFRGIRQQSELTDDEYVELLSVFVQSIRYETFAENPVKFPIETFTDKSGDCDDKSLLLAGLLSREGYRVALLSFPDQSHMAVGIACTGTDYKGTGYAYIETTNFSFVGVPPDGLAGGVVLTPDDPLVIPLGNGSKAYGACDQTRFLHDTYILTDKRFVELSGQAESLKNELQSLKATGNIKTYNLRVPIYNALAGRLQQNALVHNYIVEHQYDRVGTYAWVRSHAVGL
ncbi:MAG: hypothetical protein OS112_01860 [Methanoregula sp.]|nr:MAG: hypothetical protein OS112_01860 [Methanoregula sp.]